MKTVQSIMTANPCCCTSDTKLQDVAALMIKFNCGEIPIVDDLKNMRIMGVVTDRDIVCRTLGKNISPMDVPVSDVMTFPPISVSPDATLEECCERMETNRIRRIPVVDDFDRLCGMVSQADIVIKDQEHAMEVLREISVPGEGASLQH